LGAKDIYLIGADFCFKNEFDHWYGDKVYRKPDIGTKENNHHQIVDVKCNNKIYKTTAYFRDSAAHIDKLLPGYFNHVNVFDFSNGLMNYPKKLNVDNFFNIIVS
jgi:hypothetical protein